MPTVRAGLVPAPSRFQAALQSAQANLVRVREQEGRLLTELHDEIKALHGMPSSFTIRRKTICFQVDLDPDPTDCAPYIEIGLRTAGGGFCGSIEVEIGNSPEQPYNLTTRDSVHLPTVTHFPMALPEAIDFIAAWAAERMP